MKKTLSLILAAAMALSLVACGSSEKPAASAPAPSAPAASAPAATPAPAPTAPDYPDGTVTVVVPFAAGSGSHVLATAAANVLQGDVTMAVTNVEGGGGSVGAMEVYNSDNDGYTMLCSTIENVAAGRVNGTYAQPDAYEKLTCVATVGGAPQILIASKASGFTTLQEVIDYATAHPGELTCSGATANSYTMAMAMLIFDQLGVDIRFVPYDSVTNASTACMAGTIDLCLYGSDNAAVPLESGDCVGIAMLSADRSSMYPDLPTAAEQCPDLCADFDYWIYRSFFMPPETPTELADIMSEKLEALMDSQDFLELLTTQKLEPNFLNRTEMADALAKRAEEVVKMYELMNAAG